MTATALWVGATLESIAIVGLAGTVYGYRSEVQALREDVEKLSPDVVRLGGRLNQLARYAMDHAELDHEPATRPITLLDRPTPAQLAAPTRPDLQAQPKVPSGRHRAAA
jgi:hypothetical protein